MQGICSFLRSVEAKTRKGKLRNETFIDGVGIQNVLLEVLERNCNKKN
jgi:hypothetical protein